MNVNVKRLASEFLLRLREYFAKMVLQVQECGKSQLQQTFHLQIFIIIFDQKMKFYIIARIEHLIACSKLLKVSAKYAAR